MAGYAWSAKENLGTATAGRFTAEYLHNNQPLGVNYHWCRHVAQSSWGTHSAFLYPTDTCWTRHPVFTTCCHRSQTRTLQQNL